MGILVTVYRSAVPPGDYHSSNLSDTVHHLCVTNIPGPFNPTKDEPGFELIAHHHYPHYPILVPIDLEPFAGLRGPMAGGNVADGSGSPGWEEAVRKITGNAERTGECIVSIHDQFEARQP